MKGLGRHKRVKCWPWAHSWSVKKGLSVALGDFAKGELWTCTTCGETKAK